MQLRLSRRNGDKQGRAIRWACKGVAWNKKQHYQNSLRRTRTQASWMPLRSSRSGRSALSLPGTIPWTVDADR
uniref:Uncharacterized protein n=1 Tax=Klebsiella phage HenuGS TaxID=3350566 RepID=A0AB74UKF7_9CAUD